MTDTPDREDDPSSVIEEWGVVLVGAQLRLVRLLFEPLIGNKITEPAEAQALLYRHAEGMRAIADRVGLESLSYDIAKQFESLADDLVELLDGP
jgi:hypothetical protein